MLSTNFRQARHINFGQRLDRWAVGTEKSKDVNFRTAIKAKLEPKFMYDNETSIMYLCSPCRQANRKLEAVDIDEDHQKLEVPNIYSEEKDNEPLSRHTYLLLFIVDEISMCDVTLLRRIEKRLRQLMRKDVVCSKATSDVSSRIDSANESRSFPSTNLQISGGPNSQTWTEEYSIHSVYAVTYHKAQGQTLDNAFLVTYRDMPPKEDLHVLNWNAGDTIRADPEALDEYKRLRVSIGKPPHPL